MIVSLWSYVAPGNGRKSMNSRGYLPWNFTVRHLNKWLFPKVKSSHSNFQPSSFQVRSVSFTGGYYIPQGYHIPYDCSYKAISLYTSNRLPFGPSHAPGKSKVGQNNTTPGGPGKTVKCVSMLFGRWKITYEWWSSKSELEWKIYSNQV